MTDLRKEIELHYAASKAPRMGMGDNPALLIVDFVEGFTNTNSPLAGSWDKEVTYTAKLLEVAREKDLPIVFTTVEFDESDLKTNLLYLKTPGIKTLIKGSDFTRIDHRLVPDKGNLIVSKKYGSAFFGTPLAAQLHVLNIDTILISGCVTSGCVRASAVDAAQSGFRPMVVRETVGDRSELANLTNLIDIEQRYGDVISFTQACQYIRSFK